MYKIFALCRITINHDKDNVNYCKELYDNMSKVHQQIEIGENFQETISLLIEYDYYSLLGQLDIHSLNHALFEQQTLSFKRLMNFCLNKRIDNENIEQKISKILGLYLINFTDYYDMTSIHKVYIKRLVPTVIEIYRDYPRMIRHWFEAIEGDEEVISFLKKKNKKIFPVSLSNYKYLPIYDLLRSFIFVEEDLLQFENLIKLFQINDIRLKKWLDSKSDILDLFIEKFLECYNNSMLKKSSDSSFENYLTTFYRILSICPNNLMTKFLSKFRIDFLEEILQTDANPIACSYIIWSITLMLPYHLEEFLKSLTEGQLFLPFIYQMKQLGKKEEILILNLISKLINLDECFISLFFDISEVELNELSINEIRIKAMTISKYNKIDISEILSRRINSGKILNLLTLNKNDFFSDFVMSNLLMFFQNSVEFNKALLDLLRSISLKINILSNEKVALTVDFLYEVYLIYLKILDKTELEKYDTLHSFKDVNYSYMLPSPEVQQLLEIELTGKESMILKLDSLSSNLELFNELIIQLYVDSKIRCIIYKN